jgi:LCP family protein required for cell wall assembly
VVLTASAALVYHRLDSNIHSADINSRLGDDRPVDTNPGAQNIVVLGSDSRQGLGGQYGNGFTTAQSDTLMLVHLAADRKSATVLSIPRDSWVSIPSCQEGDGTLTAPHHAKINEAFALGSLKGDKATGAACTIKTVEQNTGVRVDHFVVVDFEGFKQMVNALGGVDVCLPRPVDDPKAHLKLPAGHSVIRDEQALAFVRERYALGDGSDLGRIGRQQQFMAALAAKAQAQLFNPAAMYGFLRAATSSITTDSGLGSLSKLFSLGQSVRSLPAGAITFLTVPNYPRALEVSSDTANVLWKQPDANAIFAALRSDTPIGRNGVPSGAASPSPSGGGSATTSPSSRSTTPEAAPTGTPSTGVC